MLWAAAARSTALSCRCMFSPPAFGRHRSAPSALCRRSYCIAVRSSGALSQAALGAPFDVAIEYGLGRSQSCLRADKSMRST